MADKNSNFEPLLSDSLLPDVFLYRYSDSLSREGLILYLWLNMSFGAKQFSYKEVKDIKILPQAQFEQAIAELVSSGLVIRSGDDFNLVDLKMQEVEDYVKVRMARGVSAEGLELGEDKRRDVLASSISKTYFQGKMSYIYYRLIDKCLYQYKFEDVVVYKLFEEGKNRNFHRSIGAMEKVAAEWNSKGYNTKDRLSQYFENNKKIESIEKSINRIMRRKLNGLDMERVIKWVEDLKVSQELIEYAFRANEYRGKITLVNVEDTLTRWIEADVKTVDDAIKYEEEQHQENKRKAVRKSVRKDSAYRTGQEAGIISEEDQPAFGSVDENNKKQDGDSSNDSQMNDILNMFGD